MSTNPTEAMTVEAQAARKQGFKKLGIVGISLIIEITLIVLLFTSLGYIAEWVNIINKGISLFLVLIISGQRKTSSIKISWIILILVFPRFFLPSILSYNPSLSLSNSWPLFSPIVIHR